MTVNESDAARTPETNEISADLLAILVCPVDHAALETIRGGLSCTVCGRVYPVENGIPNFVVDV